MTPTTNEVCFASGRTEATMIAGWPSRVTTTSHCPSRGNRFPVASGGNGAGSFAFSAGSGAGTAPAAGGIPPAGSPPTGGSANWYCTCCSQVIRKFRPWSRPHSASLAGTGSLLGIPQRVADDRSGGQYTGDGQGQQAA